MISREGIEAAVIALLWTRMGRHIDLGRFFQFSSVFLSLFAVQLLVKAFHEFTEGNLVPLVDNDYWHIATEPYGPDGSYGAYLSFTIALLPLLWVATRHGLLAQKSPTER